MGSFVQDTGINGIFSGIFSLMILFGITPYDSYVKKFFNKIFFKKAEGVFSYSTRFKELIAIREGSASSM